MTEITSRCALAEHLRLGEAVTHGRKVARQLQRPRLGDMGQSKVWISGDGTIEGQGGTGIDGQKKVYAFDVGIPRGERSGGEGETVAICEHDRPIGG